MTATSTAFRHLVGSGTLVVLDVETCPAEDGDHIVQIGVVTWKQGRQRSVWTSEVDPGVPITNSQVHRLTDADVAGAPTFDAVADRLEQLLTGTDTTLVCHHAKFDVGTLHLEYSRLAGHRQLPDLAVLDTMELPRTLGYEMPGRSRRLTAMCAHFNVVNQHPHQALSDATATAEVLHALLYVAAHSGHLDLPQLAAAVGTTTRKIPPRAAAPTKDRPADAEIPAAHLATHTALLRSKATTKQLDTWAADALACAELRCPLLLDKAITARRHAGELHPRLTAALRAKCGAFEPGQGATLVGALNALARAGVKAGKNTRPYKTWWEQNRRTLASVTRCTTTDRCPACRDGDPCPLDVAHHPLVEAMVCDDDGYITAERRKDISGSSPTAFVLKWPELGLHDLAGYAAWLAADAWLAERNPGRADRVIGQAMTAEAFDPRILRLYAERLAAQGRHSEVDDLVSTHLPRRTSDPGWAELVAWHRRYQTERAARPRARPFRPGNVPRLARPRSRVRPNPYKV